MNRNTVSRLIAAVALCAAAEPLFANTLSVPPDKPAYTVDIPADWKPKADEADNSVEATEPDNHVYMAGWVVDKSDSSQLAGDIEALLKDSMKSIDEKTGEEVVENNGIKFKVVKGSGVDKREGGKVKFFVAVFQAAPGKAGIYYVDYDADAPADVMKTIFNIMNSIKLKS
ncbi:MAG: hypothetical protein ACJ8M4_10175 [Chthoniobacterales bacterium]